MLWAYQQQLDPLRDTVLWSPVWSTLLAAVPVVVLFWLLVPRRWLAPKAAAAGAVAALAVAVIVYRMPPLSAAMAFLHGVGFGLMPVGLTIFSAMLLYNVTVETGQFAVVRRSVAGLSGDARIQALLIGFSFGAFLEGAAGGGTPVAICGAIMVGLGFDPFLAAVLCLIANTSPVAYGGLGTPLIVLSGVTGLRTETLSIMAGHQLPLLSFFIPLYMVRVMCSWRQTLAIWPALLVGGGSFALFQFTFATIHAYLPKVVLYPMTDIGGGIFSLVVTAIFLQFWKPRRELHYGNGVLGPKDSLPLPPAPGDLLPPGKADHEPPLTWWTVSVAWAPYALMSLLLLLSGFVRQLESAGPVTDHHGPVHLAGPLYTNYLVPVPALDNESERDPRLHALRPEQAALLPLAGGNPLAVAADLRVTPGLLPKAEKAEFNFAWLTNPGTPVFLSAVLSMFMLRMNWTQVRRVFALTCWQMRIPIPTIAAMLGLSYVTRYAGMDATLGYAFSGTRSLYPFFAPILGWLGVFLTGTDAGSNALFGSLQKITATEIHRAGAFGLNGLRLHQAQVLICTSNSTGGVMGKMIDAQSICVATAATNQVGREADIFKAVVWHSIVLATIVGVLTLVQAYVFPFTLMVPGR
jgi:lactate permease